MEKNMNIGTCKFCGKDKNLVCCSECGFDSILNKHKDILQESLEDKMNTKLNEILLEINSLKEAVQQVRLRQAGMKFKLKGRKKEWE